jgi:signal transduction histidine kinase
MVKVTNRNTAESYLFQIKKRINVILNNLISNAIKYKDVSKENHL